MATKKDGPHHPFDIDSGSHNSPFVGEKGGGLPSGIPSGDEDHGEESVGAGKDAPSYKTWTKTQIMPCLLLYAGMVGQVSRIFIFS